MINRKGSIQKGGMLLEAIAVLGLIAVSAPAIYKKNVERVQEIRDMSKASKLRAIKEASSSYIEKRYDDIVRDVTSEEDIHQIDINDLSEYLPNGFNTPNNVRVFINVKKKSKSATDPVESRPLSLVSALVVDDEEIDDTRAGKIVRMIGVEGGFSTDDGMIRGNKGMWKIDKTSSLYSGLGIPNNRIVVSSTFAKNTSSSEYMYRNKVEGYPEANMMFTDIDMNGNSIERVGRLALRYNNGDRWAETDDGTSGNPQGSTGGADRDAGLSLLVHGERGELIGKSRNEAKTGPEYEWWDEDVANKTHLDNRVTMELSAGGPDSSGDGYLRLNSGDDVSCSRIESNYTMPDRGMVVSGVSGGGAFVVCSNLGSDPDNPNYGSPTATLAADYEGSIGGGNPDAVGNGYMLVTNPSNNRKAVAYGDYGYSFYNPNRMAYSGGAIETVNNSGNVTAILAAQVQAGAAGADKTENHSQSSVMNLNDSSGSLKAQVRADQDGGYVHVYDDLENNPTVTLAGSKDDGEDRSHSVVARRNNMGSTKLQSDYSQTDSTANGAAIVRNEASNNEVAVMSNDSSDSGYFVLKEGLAENEKFKATSNNGAAAGGSAMYFGNRANSSSLNSGDISTKTVSVETVYNGSQGGHMNISTSGGNGSLEIASRNSDENVDTGAAMYGRNSNDQITVKLHSDTRGDTGNIRGGGLILENRTTDSKAELLTSSNEEGAGNGGTLALHHDNKRNVLVSTRGPGASGWMSLSDDDERGVDVYGEYNDGAAVLLTPKKTSSNANIATNHSTVEMFGSGQYDGNTFNSPVVNVRGKNGARSSSLVSYGNINESNSSIAGLTNKSGGIVTRDSSGENAYLIGDSNNDSTGGWARFGNNAGTLVDMHADKSSQGAKMLVGNSFKIHANDGSGESMMETVNAQASARIRVGDGGITAKEAESLIVNADSYNGVGGSYMRGFILSAIGNNMPSFATYNKAIGHTQCIQEQKNCPIWKKNDAGVWYFTGEYRGQEIGATWGRNSDVYTGRMHDYSLYSAGESPDGRNYHLKSARHVGRYDLIKKPDDYHMDYTLSGFVDSFLGDLFNGNNYLSKHNVKSRWHDNSDSSMRDRGPWSKSSHAIRSGMDFPDQIPPEWNVDNFNY
jgi:hypothetical protein